MFSIKVLFATFLFVVLIGSCTKSELNTNITLQVGNLEITNYEYEKELAKIPVDSVLQRIQFKKSFVENAILINEAYSTGLGNDENLKEKVNKTSDFMMVQKYGYLWQKTISPIVDEYITITDSKLEKRNKIFYFDFLKCTSLDSLSEIFKIKDNLLTKDQFNELKNVSQKYSFLANNYVSLRWPFGSLFDYKEQIYKLDIGSISPRIIDNGICYYLYLDHIEYVKNSENDIEILRRELQNFKEIELEDKKSAEMDSAGRMTLYTENQNHGAKITTMNLTGFMTLYLLVKILSM